MATQIFCSWSGSRSRQLAAEVTDWLPTVVQDVQPFLSDADVHAGMAWFPRVADALENCTFGIIFLDSTNLDSHWILFEAGALMKSFERTRVVPLLFDLRISDLKGPLAQFQSKIFSEDGMLDIVKSINSILQMPLEARVLERSFGRGWSELKERVEQFNRRMYP